MNLNPARYLHFLRRRNDGATAIEFALISPIFFLLLMATVEFSLIFFASTVLENATTVGARLGMTGSTYGSAASVSRTDYITQQIVSQAQGLLKSDQIKIQCSAYTNYADASVVAPPPPSCDYGASGQTVVYQVSYVWHLFTPIIGNFFPGKQITLHATTIVPNENYAPE